MVSLQLSTESQLSLLKQESIIADINILRTSDEILEYGAELRKKGIRLGLVPTMGALHEGHLSLVRLLDGHCDVKAASIYVNPAQFGPSEDLERYPHDEALDLKLLKEAGCEVVFCPEGKEIYPDSYQTYIDVSELSKPLCGRFRPDHFRGVATIVLKLFILTNCSVAAFGLKDYQQAQVIRRMVEDLHLPVELVFGETIREDDGLAMSSRNRYIAEEKRHIALAVPSALEKARQLAAEGQNKSARLINEMKTILTKAAELEVQYIEIVDPNSLEPLEVIGDQAQALVAVFVGTTRLIDNIRIGTGAKTKPITGVSI